MYLSASSLLNKTIRIHSRNDKRSIELNAGSIAFDPNSSTPSSSLKKIDSRSLDGTSGRIIERNEKSDGKDLIIGVYE